MRLITSTVFNFLGVDLHRKHRSPGQNLLVKMLSLHAVIDNLNAGVAPGLHLTLQMLVGRARRRLEGLALGLPSGGAMY